MAYDFDLLVIGSGPAGQKAAIQAAKLHRRVAIVEKQRTVGGVCINSGTIPSKTLREAVLFLTGMTQRSMYGDSYRVQAEVTMDDLFFRTQSVIQRESDEVLAVGTSLSLGLAMGLLLGGANRLLVILALIPASAMGYTLFDRHNGSRLPRASRTS